jgi:hypothetical protein
MSKLSRMLARTRFTRSIRKSDVFIVSYPKSGVTWFRFTLAHLLTNEPLLIREADNHVPDINLLYGSLPGKNTYLPG